MNIGYARVSTLEQNLDRQIDELTKAGAEQIFCEKETGKRLDRSELQKLLAILRADDVIIITEISRLSRSLVDLLGVVEQIHHKGAHIKSLKESWLDTKSPHGKLIFHVMGALAEYEREQISERTKSGLKAAKARGRSGGKPATAHDKIEMALRMHRDGYTFAEIKQATGMARSTVLKYSALNKEKNT